LVLAVLAVFGQTAHFEFVNYDDNQNVYENPVVEKGLSAHAIAWAFTHSQVANWVPLTTLSHIVDCQFFGTDAGGHHLVNVLWHAANAVLLFLVLQQMTGCLWRSAFVAALFAIHPLRAESVAWVSERKNVLSGFFFLLTIGTYIRYVRRPTRALYLVMILMFALGLMAKSMVATLPFVLLILDYWPLGRLTKARQFPRLLTEKAPLFAMSIAACAAVAFVPGLAVIAPLGPPTAEVAHLPLLARIGNALVSYVIYLRQMVFPADLAIPYPIVPGRPSAWVVALAIAVLAVITAGVMAARKKLPFLVAGWLWYLGMLVPVIGIVEISNDASHADRYTYLPEIGLALAVTWAVAESSIGWKYRRIVLGSLMMAAISALGICGYAQTSNWRNSESLWTHTLSCTSSNSFAHLNLGAALESRGAKDEAITQYREALQIKPDYAQAHYHLAVALYAKGQTDEAIVHYKKALQVNPNFADALSGLGNASLLTGDWDEAIACYRQLVKKISRQADAWANLGQAFYRKGEMKPAADAWQQALEIKPDRLTAINNLAWLLATASDASLRNGAKSVALAKQAVQLTGRANPATLRTLAAACAEDGNFDLATDTARLALELALKQNNDTLAAGLRKEISLYQAKQPARDVK